MMFELEVGGVEGVGLEFANSLWSSLSSTVDKYIVGDDSVVTCACIILLDSYCLMVDSCCVEYKFINHCSVG